MSKQQWKLLLSSLAAISLLVGSLFVAAWFRADVGPSLLRLDLRSGTLCSPDGMCSSVPLSKMKGFFPLAGAVAFWTGSAVLVLVVIQSVWRLVAGGASSALSKLGYVLAGSALLFGFAAGFLFAPDSQGIADAADIVVESTLSPFMFMAACLMSVVTMQLATAIHVDEAAAQYKPVVLDRGRLPVTPLSVNKVPTPPQGAPVDAGRPRASTQSGSDGGRTRSPSQSGMEPVRSRAGSQSGMEPVRSRAGSQSELETARSRAPSQGPLDAARSRTPSGQTPTIDDAGRPRTPSQVQLNAARSRTPSGQVPRLQTPSGQMPTIDDAGRPRTPSQVPLDAARTRTPSGQVPRLRTPSSQSPAIEDASRPRTPSDVSVGASRSRTPSKQIPRTRSPSSEIPTIEDASPSELRSKTPSSPNELRSKTPSSPNELRSKSPSSPNELRSKSPTSQPLVARTTSPSGIADPRSKSPSSPNELRSRSPSSPPEIDSIERVHTSSSGPIDLAARLSAASAIGVLDPLGGAGASIEVAIRPPLPHPEPVSPDLIPVAPESGLTIRKRTASSAPLSEGETSQLPDIGLTIRAKPSSVAPLMPSISIGGPPDVAPPHAKVTPTAEQLAAVPAAARGKIKYTTLTAKLAGEGIDAIREDGFAGLVSWNAIIAIVARRLPPDAPFNGATFIDIVSDAGATLRILPWSRISGGLPLPDADVERARSFVQVVAAQALDAKLDAATKLFADSDGQAAQLPNVITLATHDQRFA